ncbi:hypothetical protein IZ6_09480 [Terrihabitans soli]|uniref:TIGR02301 family protein n=1 Tax=Terrihabitans soli TaxID=708113 RepID=A0A6S6QGE8_9HYPH|nr:TIGR02301 family protein [Terrihabitans soli]BCJ90213.1 hypothetical protein IZ6_09480 [Terrihabitans soli]
MIARIVLCLVLIFSVVAVESAQAQSPFDFFRRQQQQKKQQQRKPPAAQTAPGAPGTTAPGATQPGTLGLDPSANESSVPTGPAAAGTGAPMKAAPAAANTPPPPYEKDLRRISEILGALHYLRPLCGADDGAAWRDKMRALIDAEGGPADRRERLAGAFNEGYNGFQLTYRTCTPSADLAVRRYLAEGAKLTREIATRHGN